MAVNKFKKIEVLGFQSIQEEVLNTLQKLGKVQIVNTQENLPPTTTELMEQREIDTKEVDIKLQQISYIINFIKKFEKKQGFIESLRQAPEIITFEKLNKIAECFDLSATYHQCQELESQFNTVHSEETKVQTEIKFWQPWSSLGINIKDLKDTTYCTIVAGTVEAEIEEAFVQQMEEAVPEIDINVTSHQKNLSYVLLICLNTNKEKLWDILKHHEFQEIKFQGKEGTPEEILTHLKSRLQSLKNQATTLQQKGQGLLTKKEQGQALYDHYSNLQHKKKISSHLGYTRQTFSMLGWLRAKDEKRVQDGLRKFTEIDIAIKDPENDETPPVAITNSKIVSPFELVTKLYGLPHYKELDPTPLLAPFFFLFFGVCLTDAGYGIILSLGCFLSLHYFYLKEGPKKLMQLLFLCGISTFFCGVFTGSWFGDIINYLPSSMGFLKNIKNSLILLDPIKDPITFLIFALILGFIQVWFGVFVQMYKDLQAKEMQDAFLSRLPWLVLLPGIILLMLVKGNILHGALWAGVAKWSSLLSSGTLLLFEGRSHKNIFGRLGTGMLALYGIVGYYADMLSYCRLLALGLATAVIANVVNQMAFLTVKIPYVGIPAMAAILIGGHIFNLAINLLGSFVHTSRLQFIEFFTKFFEGGGKAFNPFAIQTKYVHIEEK